MKLIIDLQGAQSPSNGQRGIGRYSRSLAEAMVRQSGSHEIMVALNGAFPQTVESLRSAFDGILPQDNFLIWQGLTPASDIDPANAWRRQASEIMRETFIAGHNPDIVHVSSLFEGLGDDVITSIGAFADGARTAATLFDLIPLIHKDPYLTNPAVEVWYQRKLGSLRRAGLWLAISESSRREAIEWLDLPKDQIFNISTAADSRFRPIQIDHAELEELRHRLGLRRPFVMYTGGIDHRKNIERLIGAYARLPASVRAAHQLAIVCSAHKESVDQLTAHAKRLGLSDDELVMTGFVSDEDLVRLYNSCKAFCFPSWHEGFGLPVLEAMQCGAPAIGSNVSSIPEVIGRKDALFDPYNEDDIAQRLHAVLSDNQYRESLIEHGLHQARNFSWSETARRAWAAFEEHHDKCEKAQPGSFRTTFGKPRLAYVSPLPPERTGIADWSAELLPELARHYDIEVVVDQQNVTDPWVIANCPVRDVDWFDRNASRYSRILYHFGNSTFHRHMFDLIGRHPGIVVLHDFFLSGIVAHMDVVEGRKGNWAQALYRSHGYHAVQERYQAQDTAEIIWKYPANVPALEPARGVIVHSNFARQLGQKFYGGQFCEDWRATRLLRRVPQPLPRDIARKQLGFGEQDFVVCSFGVTGPTKLNHRLLEAWLESGLAQDSNCRLVFVGENHGGDYGERLQRDISASDAAERIHLTGFAEPELYRLYLSAADAAVQLRTNTRGETSAAVLDCMAYALPTVINAHGSMAELPESCVVMLPDEFTPGQLATAIMTLQGDPGLRRALGERARAYVREGLSPRYIADQYHAIIEELFAHSRESRRNVALTAVAALNPKHDNEEDWLSAARSMIRNHPVVQSCRQLLVDVSELVRRDVGTGIQRVTRSILKDLLENPPEGYRVEPVYATEDRLGYRYARKFTLRFLGCPEDVLNDEPVDFQKNDIFLGLDLQPHIIPRQANAYAEMRMFGVKTYFVVYDLLPILLPGMFHEGAGDSHARWLSVLGEHADGLICISRSVAHEVTEWLSSNRVRYGRPLRVGWFHLGADIEMSAPTRGLPENAEEVLAHLSSKESFLMVGTIEPRKGHAQTLAAFELLWNAGVDVDLVIVGKKGWEVEEFASQLRSHPEAGRRLHWLESVSDEYLERIYSASSCLIAASLGEGFGLPLIEAARHGIPILARDIPVFREVAGEHAEYFAGDAPEDLAGAIEHWLTLLAKGAHPSSGDMPWLSWAESVDQLRAILFNSAWYASWPSPSEKVAEPMEQSKEVRVAAAV
jgi:glycosyltransferase involved in cell wall biosynthesis